MKPKLGEGSQGQGQDKHFWGLSQVARISLLLIANYTGQGAAKNPQRSPVRGSSDLPGSSAYDIVSCWPGAEPKMLRGP